MPLQTHLISRLKTFCVIYINPDIIYMKELNAMKIICFGWKKNKSRAVDLGVMT